MASTQKDVSLLLSLRGIRSFGFGFVNTALGFYLKGLGYSTLQVGLIITAAGFFSAFMIIVSGVLSDIMGSRKLFLIIASVLMFILGISFSLSTAFTILLFGALLGGAGSAGGGGPGGGPFGPAQQALLADKSEASGRNSVFSLNALIGTVLFSFGALSAGIPDLLASGSLERQQLFRDFFTMVGLLGLMSVLLSFMVKEEKVKVQKIQRKSSKLIGKFTGTAILNGFGMGLIPLSLITLWFNATYGASQFAISVMVWSSNIASAASFLFAPRLAKAMGSVKMIVWTRILGVVLLASLPLIPEFALSAIVYVIRGALTSIGMPIRQSYMMGVIDREQRSTAVGVSSGVGWGLPYAVTPVISGYVMQEVSESLPLFASATFQAANSALYWFLFHDLKPPEELER